MNVKIPGQDKPLSMRIEGIVRFIAEHQAEIEAIPVGKLILHFAGRKVVPELSRSYRSLHDEEPTAKA